MIEFEINGKRYFQKNTFDEITIADAVQLSELTYGAETTHQELTDIARKCMVILSGCDQIELVPDHMIMSVYARYIQPLHVPIIKCYYEAPIAKCVIVNKKQYQLPDIVRIFDHELLMADVTAEVFIECMSAFEMKTKGLAALCSVLLSGTHYDEKKVLKSISEFENAPMSVAWVCLNYLLHALDDMGNRYKWIFKGSGMDNKHKSAFERSGLGDFGYRSWLYEAAESGMCGNLEQVKQMNVWEFISVLSYIRAGGNYQKFLYE